MLSNFWIYIEGEVGDLEFVCFWILYFDDKIDVNLGNDGICVDFVVSMLDV